MYKILIVNEKELIPQSKIKNEQCIKYIQKGEIEKVLKTQEFDLIYIKDDLMTEKIRKRIECDFIILPLKLNKLKSKDIGYLTFINLQIINKLIMENIGIIRFKNYYEEMVIASIIKMKIIEELNIRQIASKICKNKIQRIKMKNAIENVIIRDYAGNSIMRKIRYVFKKKMIWNRFFYKILDNIEKDIDNMKI